MMNDRENILRFEKELRSTNRLGIENLIIKIRATGFYEVGGSGGHDLGKGGTLNHSLWVLDVARIEQKKNPGQYGSISDSSLVLVCLLHDLGNTSRNKSFYQYSGHGRRSALIADYVRRVDLLDISDVELAAIRFHRGNRIVDDFDKRLYVYTGSPIIKLLKRADWIAAGVFNNIPYGSRAIESVLCNRNPVELKVQFVPSVRYWYLDTRGINPGYFQTKKGNIVPSALSIEKNVISCCFVALYAFGAYDLLFLKDQTGGMGIMTTVEYEQEYGALYRSDGRGFSYRKAVLYYNRYQFANAYYLAVEDKEGVWSVIRITPGGKPKGNYGEFHERHLVARGCQSESDALDSVRKMRHGIDLRNADFFIRFEV